jgi:hypothetical protein
VINCEEVAGPRPRHLPTSVGPSQLKHKSVSPTEKEANMTLSQELLALVRQRARRYFTNVPPATAIAPLMRLDSTSAVLDVASSIGSVFFVSKYGVFVTARHNVSGETKENLAVLVLANRTFRHWRRRVSEKRWLSEPVLPGSQLVPCRVRDLWVSSSADLAVGTIHVPTKAERDRRGFSFSLVRVCSSAQRDEGTRVYSYGWAATQESSLDGLRHFDCSPGFYEGELHEYREGGIPGREWPLVTHSVLLAGGMSGGPLILRRNHAVIGVNCSGLDPARDTPDWGTATDIRSLLQEPFPFEIDSYKGLTFNNVFELEGIIAS